MITIQIKKMMSVAIAAAWCAAGAHGAGTSIYREPFRPQFHFTPEKNWMNDPNGLVYYRGEYHLFYQYNPFGDKWGHMSWAHAVSGDLVHWTNLPLALAEENGIMIFSGSAVVDWGNTSGFGTNGEPPMVAIYTGNHTDHPLQDQNIAYSTDHGRTWTKYAGNPVIDIHQAEFRDPKVQWYEPAKQWLMTVSLPTSHKVRFYGSPNLKEWTLLSEFGPAGATGGVWECPDLFELPVEGTKERRWVLVVNVGSGSVAGGSGAQYFIGKFDGSRFTLDNSGEGTPALWVDYGKDYYAAVSWNDVPDRRLWLGWMSNWEYGQDVPTAPWRSAMSIPRQVSLRKTAAGIRLVQEPVKELTKLREKSLSFKGGTLNEANAWLKRQTVVGDRLEMDVELPASDSGKRGLQVFKGTGGETTIGLDPAREIIFLDRTRSGNANFQAKFPGVHEAPLSSAHKPVRLHVLLDACSVEVFANDGEVVFTDLVFPGKDSRDIEFFGPAGARVGTVKTWRLKSAIQQ